METFNSFASIVPEPSVSNKSNASRISCFCSSVNPVEDEDEVVPFFAFNRERENVLGSVYIHTHTNKHKRNQSLVRFIFRARHKHTHKRHHILKIDGEERAKKKSVDSLSRFIRKSSITRERRERERERDERNKNEKNTKNNNNCIVVFSIVVVAKLTMMMVFYVCVVFRGARSK